MALFTRMPGRYINQYEENEFASYEFTGDKGSVVVVEGHKIRMGYTWAGDKKKPAFSPGDPQIRKRREEDRRHHSVSQE